MAVLEKKIRKKKTWVFRRPFMAISSGAGETNK
jgi:hypothetical protein